MRSVMRGLAWAVGAPLLGLVVIYGVLVLINWNDEPPSPTARRFKAMQPDRAALVDANNAYLDLLGFNAPAGVDAHALGLKRLAQIERGNVAKPGEPVLDFDARRAPAFRAIVEACREGGAGCERALDGQVDNVDAWATSDAPWLSRYETLLTRRRWQEVVPRDVFTSFPPYQYPMSAQQIYLLKTWAIAKHGDAAAVRSRLDADLVLWRTVLGSADTLITKAMAMAAIRRHFALGSVALRALPPTAVSDATPPAWRRPLSMDERSMARVFAGEWRFADAQMQAGISASRGASVMSRAAERVTAPMFQPQASSNRHASQMAALGAVSERPYREVAGALQALHAKEASARRAIRLYNPVGNLLEMIGVADISMDAHVRRAADLEGVRRTALLAQELRSARVVDGGIERAITDSALRDPYSGQPLRWDAAARTIVFDGLGRGERGRFAVQP